MREYKETHEIRGVYDKETGGVRYIQNKGEHDEFAKTIFVEEVLAKFDGKKITLLIEHLTSI